MILNLTSNYKKENEKWERKRMSEILCSSGKGIPEKLNMLEEVLRECEEEVSRYAISPLTAVEIMSVKVCDESADCPDYSSWIERHRDLISYYDPFNIINMDEAALFWRTLLFVSLEEKAQYVRKLIRIAWPKFLRVLELTAQNFL